MLGLTHWNEIEPNQDRIIEYVENRGGNAQYVTLLINQGVMLMQ
jgi:hypothetical protein